MRDVYKRQVKDVHTPELARKAGMPDNPGFDLWSVRPANKRSIDCLLYTSRMTMSPRADQARQKHGKNRGRI